jgi:hypothetical protein
MQAPTDNVGQMIPQMFPNQVMQLQKIPSNTVTSYNKTTCVINYVFNTIFRDDYFNSLSNNCSFTLPLKLKNVMSINLAALQLPNVASTFSDSKGTNVIYIAENTTLKQGLVTLPSGNYSIYEFVEALQLAINDQLGTDNRFQVTLNPHTYRLKITNTENTFYMNLMEKSNTDFDYKCLYDIDENTNPGENTIGKEKVKVIDFVSSMGYLMGFIKPQYNGQKSYQTESVYNDTFQDYVYVELNDYTGNQFESTVGVFPTSYISKNILAVMPITAAKLSVNFDSNANFVQKVRNYSAPVNVGRISVRILGPAGELMDLKNTDYMFMLQVTTVLDNIAPFVAMG